MKLTKKILIGSLAAFAIAMLTGCPGDGPTPPGDEPYYGENKYGTPSKNLLDNGDAEGTEGEIMDVDTYNFTKETVDVEGGHAFKITQTGSWGELIIDLTDYYAPGKSYLISAKVKNNPDAEAAYKDAAFTASYCVYSGAVKNWAIAEKKRTGEDIEHYDFPGDIEGIVGPWGGAKVTTGADYECENWPYTDDEFNVVTELSDDWEEIKYIIPSTEIERMINNTGLYVFEVEFYAGGSNECPAGYSYLIDDISIIDFNSEIRRTGRTWKDPNAKDPNEEEPEEGEDDSEE